MSDFRTVLQAPASDVKIDLKDAVLTIGSCFSNSIGGLLKDYKVTTCVNPFGTLFNPHSINKALLYAIDDTTVPHHTFTQHQEVYLNYDFHSELSSLDREELAGKLQHTITSTGTFLKNAQWLIITYGTSWVYERNDMGEIVANCHKQPASNFTKSLLASEKIIESFENLYKQLKSFNPAINIILTVSPVRHVKDTLPLNSVSKASLRMAAHALSSRYNDVHYFPAYEIMLDDLRDYRFYKQDMIHPTDEAQQYIWKKFTDAYATDEFKKFMGSWTEILAAIAHRPFHPATKAYQQFLQQTLEKLKNLEGIVNIDFEKNLLQNKLINRN